MKKIILLLLILIISSNIALAQYYADVDMEVTKEGYLSIEGKTNHPELNIKNSPDYTSKKGRYWLLNITLNDKFSNYIYRLDLPKHSKVNYLKTPELSRIEEESGSIRIVGKGENKPFVVIVQYQYDVIDKSYVVPMLIIAAIFFVLYIIYHFKHISEQPKVNLDILTDRQKQIYILIEKSKKPITQAKLEKLTKLPKSSLSRNIESMVRKGIIQKERKGMSNILFLKK